MIFLGLGFLFGIRGVGRRTVTSAPGVKCFIRKKNLISIPTAVNDIVF